MGLKHGGVKPRIFGMDGFEVVVPPTPVYLTQDCNVEGCPNKVLALKDTPECELHCRGGCWFSRHEQIIRQKVR